MTKTRTISVNFIQDGFDITPDDLKDFLFAADDIKRLKTYVDTVKNNEFVVTLNRLRFEQFPRFFHFQNVTEIELDSKYCPDIPREECPDISYPKQATVPF